MIQKHRYDREIGGQLEADAAIGLKLMVTASQ
jgi:hypothetical protein